MKTPLLPGPPPAARRQPGLLVFALLMLVVLLAAPSTGRAQLYLGLGAHYSTLYTQPGLNVEGSYLIGGLTGISGDFTYFLPEDESFLLEFNTNVRVRIPLKKGSDRFNLAPFAGVQIAGYKPLVDSLPAELGVTETVFDYGINLGAEFEFRVGENLFLVPQARYVLVAPWNQFMLGLKARFMIADPGADKEREEQLRKGQDE